MIEDHSGPDLQGRRWRAGEAERRGRARSNVALDSALIFGRADGSVACTIRNIGPAGARVVLAEPVELAEPVSLLVREGTCRNVLVRWRIGLEVGLEFIG
jgi:hypothetical protein